MTGNVRAEQKAKSSATTTIGSPVANNAPCKSRQGLGEEDGAEEKVGRTFSSPAKRHGAVSKDSQGVIPRAVKDIFHFAQRGATATPETPACRQLNPPFEAQDSCHSRVEQQATAARSGDSTCESPRGRSVSGSSGRSRSSDESLALAPPAAHWPLDEPSEYVQQDRNIFNAGKKQTPDRTEMSEDGSNEGGYEGGRACPRSETRCCVECSYMQV